MLKLVMENIKLLTPYKDIIFYFKTIKKERAL